MDGATESTHSACWLLGLAVHAYLPHVTQPVYLFAVSNNAPVAVVLQWLVAERTTQLVQGASCLLSLAVHAYLPHAHNLRVCLLWPSRSYCCSYAMVGGGRSNIASGKCVLFAEVDCACLPATHHMYVLVCCRQHTAAVAAPQRLAVDGPTEPTDSESCLLGLAVVA